MDIFRRLDFNVKGSDGSSEKTTMGGIVTLASSAICLLLFLSELSRYMRVDVVNHMTVDSTPSAGSVPINFHITFPLVDCTDITFEAESTRGDAVVEVPIPPRKMSARGDETSLSQKGKGCSVKGQLFTSKVSGEFRINLGKPITPHLASMVNMDLQSNLTSHKIHHFSIGEDFKGKAFPLNDLETVTNEEGHYLYHLRVIPTVEKRLNKAPSYNYQFAWQESLHKGMRISPGVSALTFEAPGVHFFYDFYPIMVEYSETKLSFLQFLTSIFAIVGGVFTISSIIDSCIYQSARAMKKRS